MFKFWGHFLVENFTMSDFWQKIMPRSFKNEIFHEKLRDTIFEPAASEFRIKSTSKSMFSSKNIDLFQITRNLLILEKIRTS